MKNRSHLAGSFPPLVTPFQDGEVDYAQYEQLIEFHVSNGSNGVLVNGTTAEPSTLTTKERNQLVDLAVRATAGALPVVAATGSQSLEETKLLTRHAASAGVDALLIVTPYYIRPPQRGLVEYYRNVVDGIDTPWMIYNIPGRTACSISLETLEVLRESTKSFVGMKHAVNDLGFVSECIAKFGPEFKVFVGLEELSFPMMAVGACGLMNAVGNLFPETLSRICDAVAVGNLKQGRNLHESLLEINQSVFYDTNPIPIKYMMKRMGLLKSNEHRLPMVPATKELEARLDKVLESSRLFDCAG